MTGNSTRGASVVSCAWDGLKPVPWPLVLGGRFGAVVNFTSSSSSSSSWIITAGVKLLNVGVGGGGGGGGLETVGGGGGGGGLKTVVGLFSSSCEGLKFLFKLGLRLKLKGPLILLLDESSCSGFASFSTRSPPLTGSLSGSKVCQLLLAYPELVEIAGRSVSYCLDGLMVASSLTVHSLSKFVLGSGLT